MVTKDKIIQCELQNMAGCAPLPGGSGACWLGFWAAHLNIPGFDLSTATGKCELKEIT